jgi:hypothetical protein
MSEKEQIKQMDITSREENLLKTIHNLGFGEIVIYVADGQPVRIEEIKKSIKL